MYFAFSGFVTYISDLTTTFSELFSTYPTVFMLSSRNVTKFVYPGEAAVTINLFVLKGAKSKYHV